MLAAGFSVRRVELDPTRTGKVDLDPGMGRAAADQYDI
jgi:hypothetical protein